MMLVIRRESFDRSNEESGDLDLLVTLVRLDRRARIRKPVCNFSFRKEFVRILPK